MGDIDHVVRVYDAEGYQTVANDGEEGNENIIDYVDDVVFATADVDPSDQEKNPCETEEGNERGV